MSIGPSGGGLCAAGTAGTELCVAVVAVVVISGSLTDAVLVVDSETDSFQSEPPSHAQFRHFGEDPYCCSIAQVMYRRLGLTSPGSVIFGCQGVTLIFAMASAFPPLTVWNPSYRPAELRCASVRRDCQTRTLSSIPKDLSADFSSEIRMHRI